MCAVVPRDEWVLLRKRDEGRYFRIVDCWMTAYTVLDFSKFLWYGPYWGARKHYADPLFLRMAEWLMRWDKKIKFFIVSREYCKTQMAILYQAWRFVQDTSRRLLIRAHNAKKAQQIGRGIRELIDSQRFQRRYPWCHSAKKDNGSMTELWGSKGMLLEREDIGVRVPSVEMCGLDEDPVGGHFTDYLSDDYAVEETETSEMLQPRLFSRFQSDENLVLAGGRRLFNGTPWAKDGFIDSARKREGIFKSIDYELFYQPGEVEVFPDPITGTECELLEDRLTFHVNDTILEEDVRYCQARITMPTPGMSDSETLIREIVWCDREHFRVNRKIDTVYTGKPLAYTIGNTRPAAPNRFTMDEVDLLAPEGSVEIMDRSSLVQKRRTQGPYWYGCNILLDPAPKELRLFNSERVQYISRKEFDDLVAKMSGLWYAKADLATAKKTVSRTAFSYGFVCFEGVFLRRTFWGLPKTDAILREIFSGVIWLDEVYHAYLRHLHFETAHIEHTIKEQLPKIMADPYSYFVAFPEHKEFAEQKLGPRGSIHVPLVSDSRGNASKMDRIVHNIDSVLEQERFYIVEGLEHEDRLIKEMDEATLANDQGVDLLETVADLCSEWIPERRKAERPDAAPFGTVNYGDAIRKARRNQSMAGMGVGGYG